MFFLFLFVLVCVFFVIGVGGGYVIYDESMEGDGNFDLFENFCGEGDGKN